jgi:hypothetical protein
MEIRKIDPLRSMDLRCCFTSGIEGAADTFRPSQRPLLPVEPLPQVCDANAVCRAEPRCWKLSGVQSFADLIVTGSNENGSLFDGYCDPVKQW